MFRRGRWFRSHVIHSDEGFSVVVGKNGIAYREGERSMSITAEWTVAGIAIYTHTIGRWDDDPLHSVDSGKKREIASNIKRALESQGEKVDLL